MTTTEQVEQIHTSLINGQRKQAVKQINDYGLYDFWNDYKYYLSEFTGGDIEKKYNYFSDLVISYFRITNR